MLVTDTSDDLYIGLVFLLTPLGIGLTLWMTVRGLRLLLGRRGGRDARTLVRGAAAVAWACAFGFYTWGLLHFVTLDESRQAQACEERLGAERARSVDGYEYAFLPVKFRCHLTGGQTYDAVVPGYVNPAAGLFGVTAAALTYAARPKNWLEETKK
ncbi:hypothetical protein N7925_14775 [Streptomyces sp. CA-278952]|uniref:hypothetical protein n=1 Tax=unclassified Streptomyces TaxID=2593676 RepID=UPI002242919D|nr:MULTISPECIES: hypothetical protein [unclassified Streptomyces]UZI29566.1 hypothetical protein OH133_16260 [Streptomyces sp. VB1]WDG29525.1 hypothetical protein N7925_14775 [Streptomyces sp. CA-278952]